MPSALKTRKLIPPITTITGTLNTSDDIESNSRGNLVAYSGFSHQGTIRGTNEDHLLFWFADEDSLILETNKPVKYIIGVFDGHGGPQAAAFAKDRLPQFLQDYLSSRPNQDIGETLRQSMTAFDNHLLKSLAATPGLEKTGTCALFLVKVAERVFVVNVGDSKAIISRGQGSPVEDLVTPHRPDVESEAARIIEKGGHVYRNHNSGSPQKQGLYQLVNRGQKMPLRVFPGNLSVSRTLGDAAVKAFNPAIVISEPQVVEVQDDFCYLLLASDGVFDTLDNADLSATLEKALADNKYTSVEDAVDTAVSLLFQQLIESYCYDNISAVLVAGNRLQSFDGYKINS